MHINAAFDWKCQPEAEAIVMNALKQAALANPLIAKLEHELLAYTSTRLFDWLDHVILGYSRALESELSNSGYRIEFSGLDYRVYHHPGAQLPRIIVKDEGLPVMGVAVAVESIADFLMVRGLMAWIEGTPFSAYRRCCVAIENSVSLWAVERRGSRAMEPAHSDLTHADRYFEAQELWQMRPRSIEDEEEAFAKTLSIAEEIIEMLGRDMAAWLVLEIERKYWQARNTAGQLQKSRQDHLGMGWANHDHHTFRSSRKHFTKLVRLFEMLGFACRERFYAGQEAGWGAQVMENPNAGLVLFLDVDLEGHEIGIDFAHQPLSEQSHLGTIGLWCALHGDSILKSGMHHLEAQFMFEELTNDLNKAGVGMMEPFSNFPYLKQAFTRGELWKVDPMRLEQLIKKGIIDHTQADKFQRDGAIGSHLENLQRREGYKGFNQKNVSIIIKETDPRKALQGDS